MPKRKYTKSNGVVCMHLEGLVQDIEALQELQVESNL